MIRVRKEVLERLIAHARRELPIEACGYLAGSNGTVTVHYELRNGDDSSEHFSFDVQEQFAAVKDMRSKGLSILTVYHSHPSTPARPSDEDIRLAHDPNVSYVIVSLAGGNEEIKSYKIRNGTAENERMEVIDNDKL